MRVQSEEKPYDDINITPMLDLAYVLLVIFILMCTASVQGIKVNLPKASAAPTLAKPQTKAITITADGTIYLDTFPVSMAQLESLLRQYKAVNPNLPFHHLRGGANLQWLCLTELGGVEIKGAGSVALADPNFSDCEFVDVQEHGCLKKSRLKAIICPPQIVSRKPEYGSSR